MAKILLVEDEAPLRDLLVRRLKKQNFAVVLAEDGAQACAAAEAEMPDLILMDMKMPVLDGLEATRRIKATPQTRAIPIIGLSCHARDEDRDRALQAGCDEYETKPIDLPALLSKMRRLLNGNDCHEQ